MHSQLSRDIFDYKATMNHFVYLRRSVITLRFYGIGLVSRNFLPRKPPTEITVLFDNIITPTNRASPSFENF